MTALFRRSAAILMVSALALFAQGAEFSYDDPVFLKGIELVNQKKYAEAAVKWRDVLNRQPGHPGAYYFAGVSRFELGELDKAAYNFKRAFDYPDKGFNAWSSYCSRHTTCYDRPAAAFLEHSLFRRQGNKPVQKIPGNLF